MSGVNRIERWMYDDAVHEDERDDIKHLEHITKLKGNTLSYCLDLVVHSESDAVKAINLLEKILIDIRSSID